MAMGIGGEHGVAAQSLIDDPKILAGHDGACRTGGV